MPPTSERPDPRDRPVPPAQAIARAYARIAAVMEHEAEQLPAGVDRDAIEACAAKLRRRAPAGPRRVVV